MHSVRYRLFKAWIEGFEHDGGDQWLNIRQQDRGGAQRDAENADPLPRREFP
jgi:hypothetical protein